MSKDATQKSTVMPDPRTAQWQNLSRQLAAAIAGGLGFGGLQGAAGGVTSGLAVPDFTDIIKQTAERQRGLANVQASDYATRAGAFGGSREAVLRSGLLGEVNRGEQGALAQNAADQFQRALSVLGMFGALGNQGGQTTTNYMQGNTLGGLLGAAGTIGGLAGLGGGNMLGNWAYK